MSMVNTYIRSTPKFMEILHSCIGQMSDGIWENTRSMEKYWKSLSIETSSEGFIIINDRNWACPDPVAFMANKIKQIVKIEIEDGNTEMYWDRLCAAQPSYIGYGERITVGDCYHLYELLKGRTTGKHSYATYSTYKVDVTIREATFTVEVEALSESRARNQAVQLLMGEVKAVIKSA